MALAAIAVALATVASTPSATEPTHTQKAVERVLSCPGARAGVRYYRAMFARHRRAQRLPGPVPYVRYDCPATIRRAAEWRNRAAREREHAQAWRTFHFGWREWLPRTWYVVGSCETGYGGDPNFGHQNSRFVSAFGISRVVYDGNAALMGAPPWPTYRQQQAGVPLPTPREQLLAAVGHYRRFGDGWTCPGPAGPGAASYGIRTRAR